MKLTPLMSLLQEYLDIKILQYYHRGYENRLIHAPNASRVKIYLAVQLFLTPLKITCAPNNLSGARG